jgi:hypothetical protein
MTAGVRAGSSNDGYFVVAGTDRISIDGTGRVNVPGTIVSTSPTTGALTVAGGLGVNGAANIAGNTAITANLGIGSAVSTYKVEVAGGSLGTTAGNQTLLQRFTTSTSNSDFLEITKTRISNGTSWNSAGTRIQQRVDSTWMGYIQFNGNNDGGLSFGTGTAASATAIAERMRLDSSGRMTLPFQPAFDVSSNTAVTASNVQSFNVVYVNRGNHFSTANGRFTAPVAGTYLFNTATIKSASSTTVVGRIYLRRNGTILYNSRHLRLSEGSNFGEGSCTWIVELAVNDFVDVLVGAGASHASHEYTWFNGYLIG